MQAPLFPTLLIMTLTIVSMISRPGINGGEAQPLDFFRDSDFEQENNYPCKLQSSPK